MATKKTTKGEKVRMPSPDEVFLLHQLCDGLGLPRKILVDVTPLTLYERLHPMVDRWKKVSDALSPFLKDFHPHDPVVAARVMELRKALGMPPVEG